jgi:hypothetical protein
MQRVCPAGFRLSVSHIPLKPGQIPLHLCSSIHLPGQAMGFAGIDHQPRCPRGTRLQIAARNRRRRRSWQSAARHRCYRPRIACRQAQFPELRRAVPGRIFFSRPSPVRQAIDPGAIRGPMLSAIVRPVSGETLRRCVPARGDEPQAGPSSLRRLIPAAFAIGHMAAIRTGSQLGHGG